MISVTDSNSPNRGISNYFTKMKFVLRIAGVSVSDDDSTAYKIYSVMVFTIFIGIYLVLCFIEINKPADSDDANPMIYYFFPCTLGATKALYLLKNRIEIGKLLNKVVQDPFTPNVDRGGDVEQKLTDQCVWILNAQTYFYWIAVLVVAPAEVLITIINRFRSADYHDWSFAFGRFAPLNVTYSPNYELCATYQALSAGYLAGNFISADLILAAILTHISFQFQILQNYIKQIPRLSYEKLTQENGRDCSSATNTEYGTTVPWEYLKPFISKVVRYHLAIINIAEETDALFKHLVLATYLNALATLGFFLYRVSNVPLTDSHMVGAAGEVLIMAGQLLLLCYWGEQVTVQSQEVGTAAYETDFVGKDIRFQKSLILIIRRSQKDVGITAGDFTLIGLPTFHWVIRTSYSVFMMLLNVQTQD